MSEIKKMIQQENLQNLILGDVFARRSKWGPERLNTRNVRNDFAQASETAAQKMGKSRGTNKFQRHGQQTFIKKTHEILGKFS